MKAEQLRMQPAGLSQAHVAFLERVQDSALGDESIRAADFTAASAVIPVLGFHLLSDEWEV